MTVRPWWKFWPVVCWRHLCWVPRGRACPGCVKEADLFRFFMWVHSLPTLASSEWDE